MPRKSIYKRFVPAAPASSPESQPSYWFAFSAARLLVQEDNGKYKVPFLNSLSDLDQSPLRTQYLGKLEAKPCFSAELPPDVQAPPGYVFTDLRQFYFGAEEDLFYLAGRAWQIMTWDQTHQFCGRCGHTTQLLPGENARSCPVCHFTSYPRISPAVIVAVTRENQLLLTRYASARGRWHTIIAGFLEPGETLEECVSREVLEEVNLKVKNIRYFGSQPWPFPDSLMIGFTAEYGGGEIKVDGVEIAEANWYSPANIPEVPPKMSISRELIDWFRENHTG